VFLPRRCGWKRVAIGAAALDPASVPSTWPLTNAIQPRAPIAASPRIIGMIVIARLPLARKLRAPRHQFVRRVLGVGGAINAVIYRPTMAAR
jgi:hypothetical protein